MSYTSEIQKLEKKIAALKTKETKAVIRKAKSLQKHAAAFAKKHGFKRIEHFLEALGGAPSPKAGSITHKVLKRKRATITDVLRRAVAADLRAGKKASDVAKEHGISLPSVNNIKKHSGLTKSRKGEKKATAKQVAKVAKKKVQRNRKTKNPVAAASVTEVSPPSVA